MKPGNLALLKSPVSWKVWTCADTLLVIAGQWVYLARMALQHKVLELVDGGRVTVGWWALNLCRYTHSVGFVSDMEMAQSDEHGAHLDPVTDLGGTPYTVVDTRLSDAERTDAVAYWQATLHRGYAFLRFLSLGLTYLTAWGLTFGLDSHQTCSGYGCSAMPGRQRGHFGYDAANMAPCNIALFYGIRS